MAQRYITSGRRYKENQGLATIMNPYYAKRSKEPTLDNIAVSTAAVADESVADEAIKIPETDTPGMPSNVGFQGADTGKPMTSQDVVASWGSPAKNAISDIVGLGKGMYQSTIMAPLGGLSVIPFATEAIATPLARAYNINKYANEYESLRPQAEALGYSHPDTFATSDTASKVAAAPQEGVNKGMGALSGFTMPASYTDTNAKARMIQDNYEKSQERPITSAVEDLFDVGVKSFTKKPIEGYGLPKQQGLFSIDPNATFDPEHNARDRDVAETFSRGIGAVQGWGKEGMFQPSDLDPETNTYSSESYSNSNMDANAMDAMSQGMADAQANSMNSGFSGGVGMGEGTSMGADPAGMGEGTGLW